MQVLNVLGPSIDVRFNTKLMEEISKCQDSCNVGLCEISLVCQSIQQQVNPEKRFVAFCDVSLTSVGKYFRTILRNVGNNLVTHCHNIEDKACLSYSRENLEIYIVIFALAFVVHKSKKIVHIVSGEVFALAPCTASFISNWNAPPHFVTNIGIYLLMVCTYVTWNQTEDVP